jgi:hypothetical protein
MSSSVILTVTPLSPVCGANLTQYQVTNPFGQKPVTYQELSLTVKDYTIILTLQILVVVIWLTCTLWFLQRRRLEPIRSRHPYLTVIQPFAWISYTLVANLAYINQSTPCFIVTVIQPSLAFLAAGVFFVRLAVLYIDAKIAVNNCKLHVQMKRQYSLKASDMTAESLRLTSNPSESKWNKYRRYFNEKNYIIAIGVIVCILTLPTAIAQALGGGAFGPRIEPSCHVLIQALTQFIQIAELGVEVVTSAWLFFKVRKIEENLGIKKECISQVVVIVIGLILFFPTLGGKVAILQGFCSSFHFNGYNLTYQLFPQLLFVATCLLYPILLSYNYNLETLTRRPSDQKHFSSKDPMKELMCLLSFEEGAELFKNRLQSEFSVENFLFWY